MPIQYAHSAMGFLTGLVTTLLCATVAGTAQSATTSSAMPFFMNVLPQLSHPSSKSQACSALALRLEHYLKTASEGTTLRLVDRRTSTYLDGAVGSLLLWTSQ